jgi:hypothetical protein
MAASPVELVEQVQRASLWVEQERRVLQIISSAH